MKGFLRLSVLLQLSKNKALVTQRSGAFSQTKASFSQSLYLGYDNLKNAEGYGEHFVKSIRIGSYSVRMLENVEQNNSKYGHFPRSASYNFKISKSGNRIGNNMKRINSI